MTIPLSKGRDKATNKSGSAATTSLNRPPRRTRRDGLLAPELVRQALRQSVAMLRPDIQWTNPVMFVVEIGAFLTLLFVLQAALVGS